MPFYTLLSLLLMWSLSASALLAFGLDGYVLGTILYMVGFPCGSDGKESSCNAGDPGSVPGLRRSHGEENGYPLQYSCLETSMDRGAWWATVHGITKSQIQLSN